MRITGNNSRIHLYVFPTFDSTDNIQYKLISDQLQCISDYLGWEIVFCHSYSAYDKGDLLSDKNALQEIENLWLKIK